MFYGSKSYTNLSLIFASPYIRIMVPKKREQEIKRRIDAVFGWEQLRIERGK